MSEEQSPTAPIEVVPSPDTPPPKTGPYVHVNDEIPFNCFYDSSRKVYMVEDANGLWMPVDKEGVKLRMGRLNVATRSAHREFLSDADKMILKVQETRHIAYAGPLAGFRRGVHMVNGRKILVTESPKRLEAEPGEWPLMKALQDVQWTPREEESIDQRIIANAWVKLSDEAMTACLETGQVTYGQALIMAGPKGCGKSLFQMLFTELMGGRCAQPFEYMSGLTNFNKELFYAEHQMIEDEQPHKDYRNRVRFGESIKQVTARVNRPCHGKNKDGQTLTPFWRLTISVNDEPDHMEVLPPLEDSLLDKIIILHCRKGPMPMPAGTVQEKAIFWKALMKELPHYLWWIRHEFKIPRAYQDVEEQRFGLRAYIHPNVMAMVDEMAPESRMLALIDHIIFGVSMKEWVGTAEQLSRDLCRSQDYGEQAKKALGNGQYTGRMLGKLARRLPNRVSEVRTSTARTWTIRAPASLIVDRHSPNITADIPATMEIVGSAS